MDEQGRTITIVVNKNGWPVPQDEIDASIENMLHDIGLDVYKHLFDFECDYHSSRKLIDVISDDGYIRINIYTCCSSYAIKLTILFANYEFKVTPVHIRGQ